MSQKSSAPKIKYVGTENGNGGDVVVETLKLGQINTNGRYYDPQALYDALHSPSFDRRYFSGMSTHPYSRKSMFAEYMSLSIKEDTNRPARVQQSPFMRTMALRFHMAHESAMLSECRQTGKATRFAYARLVQTHNHYLNEVASIKASKPIPIDLTRYLKLITGKDVWMPAWLKDAPDSWFQPEDVMRAGVGKSLIYNMMPDTKLYLKQVSGVFRGMPYFFSDAFTRGPAGYWPDVIEYGMSRNGPAITAQLNRERLVKPKRGRV